MGDRAAGASPPSARCRTAAFWRSASRQSSLLLSRNGPVVACFGRARLGMPLDMGEVADGILACPIMD
jgi:hypothetical protein